MKLLTHRSFFVAFALLLALVLGWNFSNTRAEEPSDDLAVLEQKVDQLFDLVSAQSADASLEPVGELVAEPEVAAAPVPGTPQDLQDQCFESTTGWEHWPSSNTYKSSPWSANFVVFEGTTVESHAKWLDFNGDGLLDYIYSSNTAGTSRLNCVHLNNGNGWDAVYKCRATYGGAGWTFWGDCAEV